jgi:hypothetical protein
MTLPLSDTTTPVCHHCRKPRAWLLLGSIVVCWHCGIEVSR